MTGAHAHFHEPGQHEVPTDNPLEAADGLGFPEYGSADFTRKLLKLLRLEGAGLDVDELMRSFTAPEPDGPGARARGAAGGRRCGGM